MSFYCIDKKCIGRESVNETFTLKIYVIKTARKKLFRGITIDKKLNFDSHIKKGICFSRPSALGPICRPSALGHSAPRPLKFLSTVFDFLPVCVVECSCCSII